MGSRSAIRGAIRRPVRHGIRRRQNQAPNGTDLAAIIANGAYVWRTYDGSAFTATDEATPASGGSDIGRVKPAAPAIASLDQNTVGLKPKAVLDGLGYLAAEFDEADDVLQSTSNIFDLKNPTYIFLIRLRPSSADAPGADVELFGTSVNYIRLVHQSASTWIVAIRLANGEAEFGGAIGDTELGQFVDAYPVGGPSITTVILEPGKLRLRTNGFNHEDEFTTSWTTQKLRNSAGFVLRNGHNYTAALYQPDSPLTDADLRAIETELMAEIGRNLDGSEL